MASPRSRKPSAGADQNTVPDAPMTTPPASGMDHSFSLQMLMEIQRAIGTLSSEVSGLHAEAEKASQKLDRLEEKISGVTHKIFAASAVVVVLLGIGGFLLNKAWDMAAGHLANLARTALTESARNIDQSPPAAAPDPPPNGKTANKKPAP